MRLPGGDQARYNGRELLLALGVADPGGTRGEQSLLYMKAGLGGTKRGSRRLSSVRHTLEKVDGPTEARRRYGTLDA